MARPKDDKKREKIISAAFEVFGKYGFDSSTIQSIAELSGVASGSIYNYFLNKEDLFNATVDEGWQNFLSQIRLINNSKEQITVKFANFLNFGFEILRKSLPLLRGMLFKANQHKILNKNLNSLFSLIEDLLMEGKTNGLLDISNDITHVSNVIKITVMGILFSAALSPPEKLDNEIESLKESVEKLFLEKLKIGY